MATDLQDTLNFEHNLKTDNLETICIELKPECSTPFIILAWYIPPNYETEALTEVNTLLETLEKEQKEISLLEM